MLMEANIALNESVMGIVNRLEKGIPFQKIDIDNLQLDKKEIDTNNCPPGIMNDIDYNYCYKNLLIEAKEWYTTLQGFSSYLAGRRMPVEKKQPKKQQN
jgi:hypothetical protein